MRLQASVPLMSIKGSGAASIGDGLLFAGAAAVFGAEAACGAAAVRAAASGQSGFMVKLVRQSSQPYRWTTDLHTLDEIANVEHLIPRDWISEGGFLPNDKMIEYIRPLVEGDVKVPSEGGLPKYVALDKSPVEKKLPPRA